MKSYILLLIFLSSFLTAMEDNQIPVNAQFQLSGHRIVDLREYVIKIQKNQDASERLYTLLKFDQHDRVISIRSLNEQTTIVERFNGITRYWLLSETDKRNIINRIETYCRDADAI